MLIYILLLFLVIFLLSIKDTYFYKNTILKLFIFSIVLIMLLVIYVFRSDGTGADYLMYHSLYYSSINILKNIFIEPGYILLNLIAQHSNNFLIIPFFVINILLIGLIFLDNTLKINKFSLISFFILTYVYLSSFNIMRQYLSIGVVCIGLSIFLKLYKYKYKTFNYLLFILFILIAKEFHSTAPFALIFLILPHIITTKKKVLISGIFTTIFFFTNIIRIAFIHLLIFFPNYVQKYEGSTMLTNFGNKGIIQFLPVIIQFIFIYIYVQDSKIKDYKINFVLSGYLLFLILYTGGGNIIVDRLQTYTYIFPIFFSCMFIDKKNNIPNVYKFSFIIFWILYYIIRLLANNSGIIPYSFI